MKLIRILFLLGAVFLTANSARAQGTLLVDQQSFTGTLIREGGFGFGQHPVQSFTPTMDSVGFVSLYLFVGWPMYGAAVNIRAESPTGPLLGSSVPLDQRTAYTGPFTFYFNTPVPVIPGSTYFLEPVVRLVDPSLSSINASPFYRYSGGTLYLDGVPTAAGYDLWFQEGIVVPEPSTAAFLFLGLGVILRRYRAAPGASPSGSPAGRLSDFSKGGAPPSGS